MYSTFFGLELGKNALITYQLAQHTVANNITNAATPGYSRQKTDLQASTPFLLPDANRAQLPGQLGTGVEVGLIRRARDMFLEKQIQQENGTLYASQAQADYFTRIDALINEPTDESIGEVLNEFWAAWQEVSAEPEDIPVRNTLLAAADRLTYLMQNKDAELNQLQTTADTTIRAKVDRINELGAQIRDINIRINQSYGIDTQPNDLLDARDQLLDELSQITDFEGHQMENGLYDITIGGHTLVQDAIFVPLAVEDDPANNNFARIYWTDDNTTASISDGEIKGLSDIRDMYIPVYRQALDDLAQGLMTSVNSVHAAGYGLNAATPSGLDFFTGTGVQDLQVNPILTADPDQIAAATNPNAPGDGSNALALAQLQNALTMAGSTQTFGVFYQNLVAQVGLDGQQNTLSQDSQQALVDSLEQQRDSISGVNLDEEMTDLMRYQEAYQAAVRMISVMDSMLDTLINGMGAGW